MGDFTGLRFDFTVVEGLRRVTRLVLSRAGSGERENLTNSTWVCRGRRTDGSSFEIAVEHGAGRGELLLTVPALAAGTHGWELFTNSEAGDWERVMYGNVVAITSEEADKLTKEAEEAGVHELRVTIPDEQGTKWQVLWGASSFAEVKVAGISVTAQQLMELQNLSEDALRELGRLDDLLVAFYSRFYEMVKIDAEDNVWVLGGVKTQTKATGESGKSPRLSTSLTWITWDDDLKAWKDEGISAVGQDGKSPYIGTRGTWIEWRNGEWFDTGIHAAGKNGVSGATVRRILVTSISELPDEGETCTGGVFYYVPSSDGYYDVFAWLEKPDGSADWHCVGEANDLATNEVYGLTKLATDAVVQGGAPVGNNASGQLSVPPASAVEPGVMRLSCWKSLEDSSSAAVGGTEDNRLRVESANAQRFGSMKHSSAEVATIPSVGLMADGSTGLLPATPERPGAMKPGSFLTHSNSIPYLQALGSTEDAAAANNFANNGALQHMFGRDWKWRQDNGYGCEGIATGDMDEKDFYSGLATSPQFRQDEHEGLTLKHATTELLGGVHIARGASDTRDTAVPRARDVAYAQTCYTKTEADEKFVTSSRLTSDFLTLEKAKQKFVAQSGGVSSIAAVEADAYARLEASGEIELGCVYLVPFPEV